MNWILLALGLCLAVAVFLWFTECGRHLTAKMRDADL